MQKPVKVDSLFGDRGRIDLNIDEGGNRDITVRVSTPGIIYKDLIILGGGSLGK